LAWPVRLVPGWLQRGVLEQVLNLVFREALEDGLLDFLEGRQACIRVEDLGVTLRLTRQGRKLCTLPEGSPADITIQGLLYAFLQLVTQEEDPDTLFFRRQLQFFGDTELGLEVKNFLAAFEPDQRLRDAARQLKLSADWLSQRLPGPR